MANLDEQLWQACFDEDWAQAAFLLEAGAGTEWLDEHENTAIMWAAAIGSLETVTLLFNRGANVHAQDRDGCNALMEASWDNHVDIVSFLADKGKFDSKLEQRLAQRLQGHGHPRAKHRRPRRVAERGSQRSHRRCP